MAVDNYLQIDFIILFSVTQILWMYKLESWKTVLLFMANGSNLRDDRDS